MEIGVAGAGAGKTTKMADKIIDIYDGICDGKMIYCITFTNNAAKCIEKKLIEHFTIIPKRIKISTIHSFLYQEVIKPYYYLLYQKHFDIISSIALPTEPKYKNFKIRQLENSNILHTSVFTEKVKWILVKKSKDRKIEKEIRAMILKTFSQYCGIIFIDEAQDIDSNFVEILKKLDECEIRLEIMGDPKQDLKGFNSLRVLMEAYSDKVAYIHSCHRCPQNHLNLSNSIIPKTEWQQSEKTFGAIKIEFENELNVRDYILSSNFDLKYISQQNDRYTTHGKGETSLQFDSLFYEMVEIITELSENKNELYIRKLAYYYTNKLIDRYQQTQNLNKAIRDSITFIKDNKKAYAKIINALKLNEVSENQRILVDSIERIKGQEGKNCLFILTIDLAAYLFKDKEENNKTKNKLYVALTRSLDKLTILVTREVEERYGKEFICEYLSNYQ
jgi:DNA polymerase III delta prime subunit